MVFRDGLPLVKGLPIMASALATLIIGGLIGISYLHDLTVGGVGDPIGRVLSWTRGLYGSHWFLAVMGFTVALVSMEVLTLLSLEWSGRVAPAWVRAGFLALFWPAMILYLAGQQYAALALASAYTGLAAFYASRTLLSPSQYGLRPGHYNYLLTLSPAILAVLTLAWLASRLLGGVYFDLALASIAFPVTAIIAVESRDIPLLLGVRPTREFIARRKTLAWRAIVAYIAALLGLVAASTRHPAGLVMGGALLLVSAAASIASLGLPEAIQASGKAVPGYVRSNLAVHLALAHAWLAVAGASLLAWGLGLGPSLWAMDTAVHAVTLGFMFNVIFGVDAVLLYGHAGIPLSKVPRPSPVPGLLLNAALILRAVHGFTGLAPGLAALSGPLAGLGIIFFYLRNIAKLRKLIASNRAG